MDSPKSQKKAPISRKKKLIIAFSALALLIIGVVTTISMPDGTEKLSGVKKHAAEYMIDEAWIKAGGINYGSIAGTVKITAEAVVEDKSESTICNAEFQDSSEDGGDYYLVTIGYRTLYGVKLKSNTFHVCRAR